MQSFGDLFANNRLLALGLLLAALAVILAVGIGLFRLTFGRRLHMSGGRTRQPRLGVVDAFDLDRQRQLVIVRRDNVEHLLMIGGPNDVLIEAAIVRAPAGLAVRDKENGTGPSVGIPAPVGNPVPAGIPQAPTPPNGLPGPGLAVLPPGPANGGGEPALVPSPSAPLPPEPQVGPGGGERDRVGPAAEPVPTGAAPTVSAGPMAPEPRLPTAATLPAGSRSLPPRPSAAAMPPRPPVAPAPRPGPAPAPRPNFSRATPVAPPSAAPVSGRPEPALNRTPGSPPVEPGRDDAASGSGAGPEQRGDERASPTPPVPAGPAAMPAGAPPAAPRQPIAPRPTPAAAPPRPQIVRNPPAAAPTARTPVPNLGSLEEEMAKLLGRPMPPPDQSNGQS